MSGLCCRRPDAGGSIWGAAASRRYEIAPVYACSPMAAGLPDPQREVRASSPGRKTVTLVPFTGATFGTGVRDPRDLHRT